MEALANAASFVQPYKARILYGAPLSHLISALLAEAPPAGGSPIESRNA
jgi:hypothetical protein